MATRNQTETDASEVVTVDGDTDPNTVTDALAPEKAAEIRKGRKRRNDLKDFVQSLVEPTIDLLIVENIPTAAVMPADAEAVIEEGMGKLEREQIHRLLSRVDDDAEYVVFVRGSGADLEGSLYSDQGTVDRTMQYGLSLHEALHVLYTNIAAQKEVLDDRVEERFQDAVFKLLNAAEDGAIEKQGREDLSEYAEIRLDLVRELFCSKPEDYDDDEVFTFWDALTATLYDYCIYETEMGDALLNGDFEFESPQTETIFRKIEPAIDQLATAVKSEPDSVQRCHLVVDFFQNYCKPLLDSDAQQQRQQPNSPNPNSDPEQQQGDNGQPQPDQGQQDPDSNGQPDGSDQEETGASQTQDSSPEDSGAESEERTVAEPTTDPDAAAEADGTSDNLDPDAYKCPECDDEFDTERGLRIHYGKKHGDVDDLEHQTDLGNGTDPEPDAGSGNDTDSDTEVDPGSDADSNARNDESPGSIQLGPLDQSIDQEGDSKDANEAGPEADQSQGAENESGSAESGAEQGAEASGREGGPADGTDAQGGEDSAGEAEQSGFDGPTVEVSGEISPDDLTADTETVEIEGQSIEDHPEIDAETETADGLEPNQPKPADQQTGQGSQKGDEPQSGEVSEDGSQESRRTSTTEDSTGESETDSETDHQQRSGSESGPDTDADSDTDGEGGVEGETDSGETPSANEGETVGETASAGGSGDGGRGDSSTSEAGQEGESTGEGGEPDPTELAQQIKGDASEAGQKGTKGGSTSTEGSDASSSDDSLNPGETGQVSLDTFGDSQNTGSESSPGVETDTGESSDTNGETEAGAGDETGANGDADSSAEKGGEENQEGAPEQSEHPVSEQTGSDTTDEVPDDQPGSESEEPGDVPTPEIGTDSQAPERDADEGDGAGSNGDPQSEEEPGVSDWQPEQDSGGVIEAPDSMDLTGSDADAEEDNREPPSPEDLQPDREAVKQEQRKQEQAVDTDGLEQELEALTEALDGDKSEQTPTRSDQPSQGQRGAGAGDGELNELTVMPTRDRTVPPDMWERVVDDAQYVSDTLAKELSLSEQDRSRRGTSTGDLDMGNLDTLQTGNPNGFKVDLPGRKKQYDLVLVVDGSGSMASWDGGADLRNGYGDINQPELIDIAQQAAARIAVAFESLGVNVAVIKFTSDEAELSKPFSVDAEHAASELLDTRNGGGTPLSDAIYLGRHLLEERANEPLMITVTDGKPKEVEDCGEEIGKAYAPVCGLTIATDCRRGNPPRKAAELEGLYDEHLFVYDENRLDERIDQFASFFGRF